MLSGPTISIVEKALLSVQHRCRRDKPKSCPVQSPGWPAHLTQSPWFEGWCLPTDFSKACSCLYINTATPAYWKWTFLLGSCVPKAQVMSQRVCT